MKYIYITLLFFLLITSCNRADNTIKQAQNKSNSIFTVPVTPQNITSTEEGIRYAAEHFWDNLNINDTIFIKDEYSVSSYFINYLELLNVIPLEQASEYIDAFVKKVSGNKELFDLFQEMASFYLYSPSSPLLNEQLYIPFAKSALSSNILTSEERIQYSYRLEVSQKNNPGDTAANFTYTTPDEKETTLHKLESPYTLLYFHNYDCENCKETLKQLASNSTIKSLIKNKVLQPLMIYTEGDIELWEEHKHNSPEGWLSGNDKNENIKMKRIYELRAMPSIYLINKEKRVILKDVQPEKLLFYLSSIEASVK